MSEETKVKLRDEDRDLLKSAIKIGTALESHKSIPPAKNTPQHDVEGLLSCPDCYPKVRKAVFKREFEGADAECVECGLPAKKHEAEKEEWTCHNCGSKEAKERE